MSNFQQHIPSFTKLLNNINVADISSNAYAGDYLQKILEHKIHFLHIYADALNKAFDAADCLPAKATLIDFGCGNGLLALFAKYCGVYEVHASDVNADFVMAAQQLSKQLNIALDGWIIGDENSLTKHFVQQKPDIIIGTDVIEHVYNLDRLFSIIQLLNPNMITVFTTASVAENPFKSKQIKKLQREDEYTGSNILHSNHPFAGWPFLQVRKQFIKTAFPELPKDTILLLAKATRGLQQNDIKPAVDNYLQKKILPTLPQNDNTCDPVTGSWTERLLTVTDYKKIYNQYGFQLSIYHGFYNSFEPGFAALIRKLANGFIKLWGIKLAPFIVLVGKRTLP